VPVKREDIKELTVVWDPDAEAAWTPHFNQCTKRYQAVLLPRGGTLTTLDLTSMVWGLDPPYTPSPSAPKLTTINARIETLAGNKGGLYTRALNAGRRCVVVCSGFFEWKSSDEYDDKKWPFYIHDTRPIEVETELGAAATHPLLLAALYEPANKLKAKAASVTIVTLPAGRRFSQLHDRQPAVLDPRTARVWLDSAGVAAGDAVAVLSEQCQELPDTVQWYPVRRDVGQVKANGAHLLDETPPTTTKATERKHGAAFMDKWVKSAGSPKKRARTAVATGTTADGTAAAVVTKVAEALVGPPDGVGDTAAATTADAVAMAVDAAPRACLACTFLNPSGSTACAVCSAPLAAELPDTTPCPRCTLLNSHAQAQCAACGGNLQ
jgi:putative SOS response-associated peptidase YedK